MASYFYERRCTCKIKDTNEYKSLTIEQMRFIDLILHMKEPDPRMEFQAEIPSYSKEIFDIINNFVAEKQNFKTRPPNGSRFIHASVRSFHQMYEDWASRLARDNKLKFEEITQRECPKYILKEKTIRNPNSNTENWDSRFSRENKIKYEEMSQKECPKYVVKDKPIRNSKTEELESSTIKKFIMDDRSSIDLDTPLNWSFAEFLLAST